MSRRTYDYATPIFGGDFCCAPPPSTERPSARVDAAYRSLQKQNSILERSLSRADSGSSRGTLARMESLGQRGQLSRGNSTTTRSESTTYTTSGAGGVPTTFSSTSYKSPYGNTYRSSNKF